MRDLRIHYIERHKAFTALCGAVSGSSNPDGSFNTCHFVPSQQSLYKPDEVCAECAALAFPQEVGA